MTTASSSRYVVGIDLGTTNSALAFADTAAPEARVATFRVPQRVAADTVEERDTLPSFLFQPPGETEFVTGLYAREEGALCPERLVVSAKSWLSHAGVDRTSALLPWHGAPDVRKLSPPAAAGRVLEHLREAWDRAHPADTLSDQEVVLTVPASFDEVARELTVEAARLAGLPRVTLIEEPQAAFYAWMRAATAEEQSLLEAGARVLVCDIGGGTTDFTLLEVRGDGKGARRFHRMAVGEHLILGGDNLDLALAHHVETRLAPGDRLAPRAWNTLVRRCREAKESLLGPDAPETFALSLPAAGARVVGGATRVVLTRADARRVLLDGFLPETPLGAEPARHGSGFREFGLPYAADAAITRYLAAFLRAHGGNGAAARPDAILLNGGFFESHALRERFLAVLRSWFDDGRDWSPRLLRSPRLDLAVAHGAAVYGLARRGDGPQIGGGLAHSYYVGVGGNRTGEPRAVCLMPAGLQEGEGGEIPGREFDLLIQQPVEFPIFSSSTRTGDAPGALVPMDPTALRTLPPARTVLRAGRKAKPGPVRVRLHARLTEVGTLEITCREARGTRAWRLPFDVRAAVQTDPPSSRGVLEQVTVLDDVAIEACTRELDRTFGETGKLARPEDLVKELEQTLSLPRDEWPLSLLRTIWDALLSREKGRHKSIPHEARWLNLLGFALRPGYGYTLDDWRISETWKVYPRGVAHPRNEMCRAEWWVLWRRIAGGLDAGQQQALADPLLATLRKGGLKAGPHEAAEIWRLLASLERLDPALRQRLGEQVLGQVIRKGGGALSGSLIWAMARIGARVPAHGPLNHVLPAGTVENWLEQLMRLKGPGERLVFCVMQLARRTGDRYRDIGPAARERVAAWLRERGAPARYITLVSEGGELDRATEAAVLGDALPLGLTLV